MPNITLGDIARTLQVSVATVSRALNPKTARLISEPTRFAIQQMAAQLGYASDVRIKRSMEGRSYTLGIVLATAFHSLFFSDHLNKMLEGIYAVLRKEEKYGCKLVLLPRERSLSEIDRHVLSSEVDGLLIGTQCDFSVDELYQLGEHLQNVLKRPVAAMNLPPKKGSRISIVSFDNREAARLGVSHLIKNGRRSIGLIYADNNAEDVRERIEGFKLALAKKRIPLRQELMVSGDFSTGSGYQAMQKILRSKTQCDALFCVNDELAIGALSAIHASGKRCPEDIAVMGFDGLAAGNLVYPPLSTVCQPVAEMATLAAQLLIDQIEGKTSIKSTHLVKAKLLLRQSV